MRIIHPPKKISKFGRIMCLSCAYPNLILIYFIREAVSAFWIIAITGLTMIPFMLVFYFVILCPFAAITAHEVKNYPDKCGGEN